MVLFQSFVGDQQCNEMKPTYFYAFSERRKLITPDACNQFNFSKNTESKGCQKQGAGRGKPAVKY